MQVLADHHGLHLQNNSDRTAQVTVELDTNMWGLASIPADAPYFCNDLHNGDSSCSFTVDPNSTIDVTFDSTWDGHFFTSGINLY